MSFTNLLGETLIATIGIGLLAVLWTAASTIWRQWQLSREQAPSTEELDEVRELRRPGTMHLSGRTSAMARHFETAPSHVSRTRRQDVWSLAPPREQQWRDSRSDR